MQVSHMSGRLNNSQMLTLYVDYQSWLHCRATQACRHLCDAISTSRTLWRSVHYAHHGRWKLRKLTSFTRWLRTHKAYVEQLRCDVPDMSPVLVTLSHVSHLRKLHLTLQYDHSNNVDEVSEILAFLDSQTGLQELSLDKDSPVQSISVDISCLAALTSLTSLHLAGNLQMLSLQQSLPALGPRLRALQLDVGNWRRQLGLLSCLSQLESIDLYDWGHEDLWPAEPSAECFPALCLLTSVSLSGMPCTFILGLHTSIHTGLETLSLFNMIGSCQLPHDSHQFPRLRSLKILHDDNMYSDSLSVALLPLAKPELGAANTTLQSLSLAGYHWRFPATILHLHSLTGLCLSHGAFEHLPAELSGLTSLKELEFCFCRNLNVCLTLLLSMSSLQTLSLNECSHRMTHDYFAEVKQIHPSLYRLVVH